MQSVVRNAALGGLGGPPPPPAAAVDKTAGVNAAAVLPDVLPLKYEFLDVLRRSQLDGPPRLKQLQQRLAAAVPEHAWLFENYHFRLVYKDHEGDQVTVETDGELEAAFRLAQDMGKVLRFVVPVSHPHAVCGATGVTPVVGTLYELVPQQQRARDDGAAPDPATQWACLRCTLFNPLGDAQCTACGDSRRPPQAVDDVSSSAAAFEHPAYLCEAAYLDLAANQPGFDPQAYAAVKVPTRDACAARAARVAEVRKEQRRAAEAAAHQACDAVVSSRVAVAHAAEAAAKAAAEADAAKAARAAAAQAYAQRRARLRQSERERRRGALAAYRRAGKAHRAGGGPPCAHTHCQLRHVTRQCCACSDQRPVSDDGYDAYVDGQGVTRVVDRARSHDYCPSCKQHGAEQQQAARALEGTLEAEVAAKAAAAEAAEGVAAAAAAAAAAAGAAVARMRAEAAAATAAAEAAAAQAAMSTEERAAVAVAAARAVASQVAVREAPAKLAATNTRWRARSQARQERVAAVQGALRPKFGCPHTQARGRPAAGTCELVESGTHCCACSDRRAFANRYTKYVDGLGERLVARRHDDYCPTCHAHFSAHPQSRDAVLESRRRACSAAVADRKWHDAVAAEVNRLDALDGEDEDDDDEPLTAAEKAAYAQLAEMQQLAAATAAEAKATAAAVSAAAATAQASVNVAEPEEEDQQAAAVTTTATSATTTPAPAAATCTAAVPVPLTEAEVAAAAAKAVAAEAEAAAEAADAEAEAAYAAAYAMAEAAAAGTTAVPVAPAAVVVAAAAAVADATQQQKEKAVAAQATALAEASQAAAAAAATAEAAKAAAAAAEVAAKAEAGAVAAAAAAAQDHKRDAKQQRRAQQRARAQELRLARGREIAAAREDLQPLCEGQEDRNRSGGGSKDVMRRYDLEQKAKREAAEASKEENRWRSLKRQSDDRQVRCAREAAAAPRGHPATGTGQGARTRRERQVEASRKACAASQAKYRAEAAVEKIEHAQCKERELFTMLQREEERFQRLLVKKKNAPFRFDTGRGGCKVSRAYRRLGETRAAFAALRVRHEKTVLHSACARIKNLQEKGQDAAAQLAVDAAACWREESGAQKDEARALAAATDARFTARRTAAAAAAGMTVEQAVVAASGTTDEVAAQATEDWKAALAAEKQASSTTRAAAKKQRRKELAQAAQESRARARQEREHAEEAAREAEAKVEAEYASLLAGVLPRADFEPPGVLDHTGLTNADRLRQLRRELRTAVATRQAAEAAWDACLATNTAGGRTTSAAGAAVVAREVAARESAVADGVARVDEAVARISALVWAAE